MLNKYIIPQDNMVYKFYIPLYNVDKDRFRLSWYDASKTDKSTVLHIKITWQHSFDYLMLTKHILKIKVHSTVHSKKWVYILIFYQLLGV